MHFPIVPNCEWNRRGEALQAKKAEALQAKKAESSNATTSKTPTNSSILKGLKYNLVSISQLCDAKSNVQLDEKRGTIFNSNKEVVMIAPRVRDVYVLDMTSSTQESCFFAKASKSLNWLWQKRLAHLNFKTINQLAKQNLVIGLPSLVYSKDKPCSSCEKEKHHRSSFKTNQTSSIKKYLHLLHMALFGPLTPRSINREKYTLVIVKEYSRSSTLEEKKLKKPITSHLMKALKLLNSQNLQLMISTLLNQKDIHLMNIFILLCLLKGAGMLIRAMAKELSATSAHECLFVDFLSKEEPKKVTEALKHPGWVDAMQEKLNQFTRNKV
ncbi:retrovirus-related pol polyprotein from transposon TNT 1-94 [Tanacetum coccineum]|uniref:Retrovirus-related pol polyprotein from transposon TNT 1-94 n=1 Tax=Tanacetum coccineum TaxID=301880 RepID=A0ABQ5BD81_9ASTR